MNNTPSNRDTMDNRLFAALSYVFVLGLLMLIFKRDSDYVQFHAKQGVVLFLVEILAWIIPPLGVILVVLAILFSVIGFWNALNGNRYRLPLVAKVAEKIKF